jgi:hypothetical protein
MHNTTTAVLHQQHQGRVTIVLQPPTTCSTVCNTICGWKSVTCIVFSFSSSLSIPHVHAKKYRVDI